MPAPRMLSPSSIAREAATIYLDPEVRKRARIRAVESRISFSEYVERALVHELEQQGDREALAARASRKGRK